MIDFSEYEDVDLDRLRVEVLTELERRQRIASAPQDADNLSKRYLEDVGRAEGTEWVQPTGAHDAYPKNSIVLHNSKEWVSLILANVWEPGVFGWREVSSVGTEWIKPTGLHDAYKTGDLVIFEGKTYMSVIDGNIRTPSGFLDGWKEV